MRADDLFTTITEQLIADIDNGATGTWRMPWHALADAGTPTSIDQRPYRGANALWLSMVAASRDWTSGVWATYRAWQRHGTQVRRGERATHVILWKPTTPRPRNDDTTTDTDPQQPADRPRLLARTYAVFAAEQVDDAAELIAQNPRLERDTPERIAAAAAYFGAVPATVHHGGNQAYYRPATDTIHLPHLAQFDTAAHYYGTRAHETIHWTGHPDRLHRDLTGRFGDDAYAAEELTAELGAAMWCAQTRLTATTRTDHANYLAGWLRVLRTDTRALITVAARAQAAVDHLNTITGHTPTALHAADASDNAA